MGLDGIGRENVPPATMPSVEAEPRATTKTFQVQRDADAVPAEPVRGAVPADATPLERLRAGEIDRDTYIDLKVDGATVHLHGLRPEELDTVRTLLHGQLANDPVLLDLVRQATGKEAT